MLLIKNNYNNNTNNKNNNNNNYYLNKHSSHMRLYPFSPRDLRGSPVSIFKRFFGYFVKVMYSRFLNNYWIINCCFIKKVYGWPKLERDFPKFTDLKGVQDTPHISRLKQKTKSLLKFVI